ncbi:NAD(P)H-binding protein [Rothia sp. AR01]|uniref:NAD(P)H-binding protein n=1 Tax=Rothia santali TaxID=2949643 RepID=A0A9X2KHJ9_9MICC|nr:NAD(P)H-binding protein [Rothia santali]MCP3424990.1 NAD(P)H-binding protein [Rothia santali]
MKIAVIGATGMVGSRVVAEASKRGHVVDAYSRGGTMVQGAETALPLDLADTAAVAEAIGAHDATVITVVSGRTGSYADDVANHRALIEAAPSGRFLVVGGAGALQADERTLLKDTPGFPAEYKPEADAFSEVYEAYRGSEGLEWTMLAPAPVIAPGERTGEYSTGDDRPAGESISAEDFAVALVDELERPAHAGRRFTAAN